MSKCSKKYYHRQQEIWKEQNSSKAQRNKFWRNYILEKVKTNWRDHRWRLVSALEHGFKHFLFVVLSPCAHWQLCDLNGGIIDDSNLTTAHVLVLTKFLDGAPEILEWRGLLHRKSSRMTGSVTQKSSWVKESATQTSSSVKVPVTQSSWRKETVLKWRDLLQREVLNCRDLHHR